MTDACAAAEPDPYALTLSFKGATATLQFHFVDFVDAKSAYDAVQRARRAPAPGGAGVAAPLTSLEIADHFGSVAEVDASAVAACVLTRTARALEAALDSGIVAARIEAKLQSTLRRDPVLRSMANAMQARRLPFRTESRISNFVEEPRTCRFR
jgi:hypothetical protein